MIKSGFVAIIGKPNVGKSSLLNNLIGEKIAITSPTPETTRNRILGALTTNEYQIIFVDTPGMGKNYNLLSKKLTEVSKASIDDNDLIYFVVDRKYHESQKELIDYFKKNHLKVFLVINKVDLMKNKDIDEIIISYMNLYDFQQYVPVSSLTGKNLDKLIELTLEELPEDGLLFPEDFVSNQTERMRMMELIREKILLHTREEIPHSVAVVIENMFYNEKLDQYDVYADILVEKSSQKQILIGKNGEKIKEIGTQARLDINKTLKTKVHLELWVKVKKDWRNDERMLVNLGIGEDW
ncbi:MAG: GTPase Era [Acholeplasmataceae bacterium]|jgi:GTP-binding protein Era